jgi:hypothetical protein
MKLCDQILNTKPIQPPGVDEATSPKLVLDMAEKTFEGIIKMSEDLRDSWIKKKLTRRVESDYANNEKKLKEIGVSLIGMSRAFGGSVNDLKKVVG